MVIVIVLLAHSFALPSYSSLCPSLCSQEANSSDSTFQASFLLVSWLVWSLGDRGWRWESAVGGGGGGGIFLPCSLPALPDLQPWLPPFNQAFCPMAPAPGIWLCLGSIILCSSLCPCKIRVVSLPLFLVSGCLDTHVYLPNQVIPSWVSLVLPGPWWHIIFMSSSLWLLFMDCSSCIRRCSIQKVSIILQMRR